MVAFFFECQIPSGVGSQAGSATDMVLVVPVNLDLEQGVGIFVVGDFFVGQERDEAILEGAEAALDFAFGRSVGGDAVRYAQGCEGALKLGVGVEPVGGGGVAKKREAIGVQAGWRSVFFDDGMKMGEVCPSRIAGSKGAAEDFTGVIIQRQNEAGVVFGGPPRVG